MAYVWVQQWVALPVIVEEQQMGDVPPDAGIGPTSRLSAEDEAQLSATQFQQGSQVRSRTPGANAPFHNQFSSLPSFQQRIEPTRIPSQQGFGSINPQSGQQQHASPFNMTAMAGSLPDYGSGGANPAFQSPQPQQQDQRRLSGASTPAVVYQLQQSLQYPPGPSNLTSPASFGNFPQSQYGSAFGQPSGGQQQSFGPYGSGQQRMPGMQQSVPSYTPLSPQQFYFAQGQQLTNYPGQVGQFPGAYGRPGQPSLSSLDTRMPSYGEASLSGLEGQSAGPRGASDSMSAIPRGPPRKPKQSGHALWVGNLPPGATVMDLKDHFSRDATKDIESLFLISKSNCAFVNYRTEAACAAAMQRFHDSRFQGVRLVCRLRRSSAPASGTPTGPSAMTGRRPSQASSSKSPMLDAPEEESADPPPEQAVEEPVEAEEPPTQKVPEKFFIVKSLTLQDLEQSVRTGIWATQSHNEEILNKAYQAAENVYLIFSANKSGEYFGYARMISPISEDAKEIYRALPQPETTDVIDAPRSIPTPATETAPKGHIIDDSARGTIFWEAEHSDEEEVEGVEALDDRPEEAQVWGKPFKVEWQSTNRLPFYRTRGLRNPWNANREVKIARDGTELEPSVGKRLVQMFHRLGPSSAGPPNMPMNMGQMPPFMGPPQTQHYPPQ